MQGGHVGRQGQGQKIPVKQLVVGEVLYDGNGERTFWEFNFLLACFSAYWLECWDSFLSLKHSNPPLLPSETPEFGIKDRDTPPGLGPGQPYGADDGAHAEPQPGCSPPCFSLSCPQKEAKNSSQAYRVLGNFNSFIWIKHWALRLGSTPHWEMEQCIYQWKCRTTWYILKVMKLCTFSYTIRALLRAAFALLHCWGLLRVCVNQGKMPAHLGSYEGFVPAGCSGLSFIVQWGSGQHRTYERRKQLRYQLRLSFKGKQALPLYD